MIPSNLQGIFWSRDVSKLSLQRDKKYIIHQVLAYGSLDNYKWLKSVYSKKEIKRVFVNYPRKTYTPSQFNFVKNYLLSITNTLPDLTYVRSTL